MKVAGFVTVFLLPLCVFAGEKNRNIIVRGSYANSQLQFEKNKTGRVAFIGGSITQMNGYRPMVADWLQERYPKTKFEFINAGITQFGSGWCWLSLKDDKLVVTKSPNAENPIINNMKPILGCDVWEHSYYIDFRNKRPAYLENFLNKLVNWENVASRM